jgi:D-inositol-3-phosphate glycosyltransferase
MKAAIIEPVGGHGGMNYYDYGLAHGLVAAGVMPIIYTCDQTDVAVGFPFRVRPFYRGIFGQGHTIERGLRYLAGSLASVVSAKWSGCSVAHLHIFHAGPLEFINALFCRLALLRLVVTVHDVESFRRSKSGLLAKGCYALADRLIAHNQVSRRELIERFAIRPGKVCVIPHGNYLGVIGDCPSQESARARIGVPEGARVLLFFGQIKEVKGLDLLLEALPGVLVACPDVVLLIAGKVWKEDFDSYQVQMERLGVKQSCVAHIHYIHDDEVGDYYSAADLVVLPYRRIYQSGVLLMAMSFGKPVLASDLPGMKEVIDDGRSGFLFKAGDAQSLAERLIAVLNDHDGLRRVALAGEQKVREQYSWERVGELTRACYEQALRDYASA